MNGKQMTGAEIIVQVLADEDCQIVFGYSGGAILPVFDSLFQYNSKRTGSEAREAIQLVVPANEQGAGFMASGYARASGKVGVVLTTSGPGATNLATPIRDAAADSVPLVAITGQVSTTSLGTDAFQEAPVTAVMSACAKHVFLVTRVELLEATIRTAFEIARSGRPGPVVIDLPKDIQIASTAFDGQARLPVQGFRSRMNHVRNSSLSQESCFALFEMLKHSKRPLIYAGGGVIADDAAQELTEFADSFGLPVTTTLMGIGAYDTSKELALHMLGMHGTAYANYAVEGCDFLFAIGARFDDRVVGVADEFAPRAKYIAQIDIDRAEIGKVKSVDWFHVGGVKHSLQQLTNYGKSHKVRLSLESWHSHIHDLKGKHSMNFQRDSALIQPQAVIECINRLTHGTAIVATGVGQHQMWAAQYLSFSRPRQWLTSGSMGTMGFGLPAAIGAQLAMPDALVVNIDGDCSIRMNIGEMETASTYGLPVKVIVLNNHGDGMVRQWQRLFFKNRYAASDKSLNTKNFVQSALADGFGWAKRIEQQDELNETVSDFLSYHGPAFLEVMIDPNADVYPMVRPGTSYSEMITGPYINSRATGPRRGNADSSVENSSITVFDVHSSPSHMF